MNFNPRLQDGLHHEAPTYSHAHHHYPPIKPESDPKGYPLLSQDFEVQTNNLINSIPFNPEMEAEAQRRQMFKPPYLTGSAYCQNPFDANYPCIYCQKRFELVTELETHLTVHTVEKPLKCELCERRFARKDKLMLHMRVHTGEKPFKCTECGRCFSRKDKLNNHIRTHTGEKPHQCFLCQKCFSRKDKLNLHMKSQHYLVLSNLEISVVKYGDKGKAVPPSTLTELLPKAK